jgi:hypothetical protein
MFTGYGRTVTVLTVRPLYVRWSLPVSSPFQDFSAECPALQYLGINEHALNVESPLRHSTVTWLDIFRDGSRDGGPPDGEFERLKSRFPRLRGCRYVESGLAFSPMARAQTEGVSSISEATDYDLPLGVSLTRLWPEELSADDGSDDSDYVSESQDEEYSGDDVEPDQYWEYYSDGERKHSPSSGNTSEDEEFDYEVERDEALAIFERALHGGSHEGEDFDDEVERDGSDNSSSYFE